MDERHSLVSGRLFQAIDAQPFLQFGDMWSVRRPRFVFAKYHHTAWCDSAAELRGNASLHMFFEVGERKVSTKDEVEGPLGHLAADVLPAELHVLAKSRPQTELRVPRLERIVAPLSGELFQASRGITSVCSPA